jgi:hypothetical protein
MAINKENYKAIPQAISISSAIHQISSSTKSQSPIIVRSCWNEFPPEILAKIRKQIRHEQVVHGYQYQTNTRIEIPGFQVLDQFDQSAHFNFNIVDSPSTRGITLLPQSIECANRNAGIMESVWLAYVITGNPVDGEWHIDPPYGSGWQFLAQGEKEWCIESLPDCERGVYKGVIYAGDWIYCPSGWRHAVKTIRKSIGLSGYTI